jgi:prepilin-type processing-associated H-X9-DG protein
MNHHGAFTSTELLAVIGLSGILSVLLLPSLAADKRIALRAGCAQNMRQLALVWQMYAADNHGQVAIQCPTGGGSWLWDVSFATRDNLVANYGLTRKVCYDPTVPSQSALWTCSACGGSVWGYWLMIKRQGSCYFGSMINKTYDRYVTYLAPSAPISPSAPDGPLPSGKMQVLLADAVGRDTATFNFATFYGSMNFPHHSPHLGPDGKPEGANVCYTDGHVEWRTFGSSWEESLRLRYIPPGGSPQHWW